MYVCMYVCMCVCVHTYIHTYLHTYVRSCVRMHVSAYVCLRINSSFKLNDVKYGGATVFPHANARVPVVKVSNCLITCHEPNCKEKLE